MKRSVAILGCGPAGLLAAYAAELSGHEPVIYSRKVKSEILGAQYIHEEVPGIPSRTAWIHYRKRGTREGYAEKVYGSPTATCSWDTFPEGRVQGFSMGDVYDLLWTRYEDAIIDIVDIRQKPYLLGGLTKSFPRVISSIPAPLLCERPYTHQFERRKIGIRESTFSALEPLTIVYNGDLSVDWYRASNLFGFCSLEYGEAVMESYRHRVGWKPIETNCDCWPEIARVGRFGRWEKGVLVSDAFKDTMEFLTP